VEDSGRVIRGGSWDSDARYVRAAYRYAFTPDARYDNVGFRLAGGER
jgi:formylglycine-generating enzyme required for sulfatase activity